MKVRNDMMRKNALKRLCAIFLCAVLFVTLLPSAFAENKADFKIAAPTLISLERQGQSLKLTWAAVSGVSRYSVHRKVNGGSWATIARVDGTSYTDTNVNGSNTYTYTVRCIDSNNVRLSWYDEAGLSYSMTWKDATPHVTGTVATNAITIKWNAVSSSGKYSVHRSVDGGSWKTIAKVSAISYTDTAISVGHTYTYTVRCLDGNDAYSSWYEAGVSFTPTAGSWQLGTPHMKSATYNGSGVVVVWDSVKNASRYSVHRKVNGGSWSTIARVTGTSYTDNSISKGNTYTYTVRCINDQNGYLSDFESGITANLSSSITPWAYPAPVLTRIQNDGNGVTIRWDPVAGVSRYSVHRKLNGGSWNTIARVNTNTYTDKNVSAGNNYTYTVRCINSGNQYLSDYDPVGLSISFYPCANPNFTITQSNGGITITWKAVSGAVKYTVHRKTGGSGSWHTIATTAATSYTDKAVTPGETYRYTVRCVNVQGAYLSWYNEKDPVVYNGVAGVMSLTNEDGYITVKWKEMPSSKVVAYRIYRKANDATVWKGLTDVAKPATSYNDTEVVSNTKYTYTVRGVDAGGNLVGDYDAVGKSIRYFDAPELISVTRDGGGITVAWNPVIGIERYQVYRKTTGDWKLVGSTGDLFFVDTDVTQNNTYYYGVKCVSKDGSTVLSGMQTMSIVGWVETPVLLNAQYHQNGVNIRWKQVDGISAGAYRVMRKTSNKGWAVITTTTPTLEDDVFTAKDESAVSGTTYWYTVYVVDSLGLQISDYDRDGVFATFFEMATIDKIWNTYGGVSFTWTVVDNTSTYHIYRRVADSQWEKIGTQSIDNRKYTDTTAQSGMNYWYAVSSGDVNDGQLNDLELFQKHIQYYKAPVLKGVRNVFGGVEVKWEDVDDITSYRVYRKTGGGDWEFIKEDTFSGYEPLKGFVDTTALNGRDYTYSVCCSNGSGTELSAKDPTGMSVHYYVAPALISAVADSGGITLQWQSVDGAASYYIYRRVPGNDWTQIGTAAGDTVTYYDKRSDSNQLIPDQVYEYTVRAVNGDIMSGYDPAGVSATAIS